MNLNIYWEKNINIEDYAFLVIYGIHVNGKFIAIPNWQICCEAGTAKSYNRMKLIEILKPKLNKEASFYAEELAEAIDKENEKYGLREKKQNLD